MKAAGPGPPGADAAALVRVLVVDDQLLVRRGLVKLLELEPALEVVGEAASGEAALHLIRDRRPDVVLVDARMPGMDGIELVARLAAEQPGVRALILTTFDDDEYVVGGLRAGARGYLLKDASPEELADAVVRVAAGETVLAPAVTGRVVAALRAPAAPPPEAAAPDGLSARETEVLRLVGAGATNREIAARLFIGEGTARNHVSSVLRKLGLRDRTQAALYAAERWPRP